MAAPLLINEDIKRQIDRVVLHAETHIYDQHMMEQRIAGILPPPGDVPGFAVDIPVGYRCVFSIETSPDNGFMFRRLSISNVVTKKLIHPTFMEELMKMFGYTPFINYTKHIKLHPDNLVEVLEKYDQAPLPRNGDLTPTQAN